jgi:DNA-binding transcriptional regulator YiaG
LLIFPINIFKDIKYIIRDVKLITGIQIRAARSSLKWSASQLSKASGVSVPTIQRFEQAEGVPPSRSSTLIDIKKTLEAAGIEFIGTPDDGPGIRLRKPKV